MNYITKTYAPDLLGTTPDIIDEVISLTEKLKSLYDRLNLRCYSKKTFEEIEACEVLKPIIEILGDNEYLAGTELTHVDFFMLELCEYGQYLS